MNNILNLLEQGIDLAKTPTQRAQVSQVAEEFGKRLSSINSALDESEKNWADLEDVRAQTEEIRECTKRGILWSGKDAVRRSQNPLYYWNETKRAWMLK